MNAIERAAWAASFTAAWVAYHVVKSVMRRLDVNAWKAAWDRVAPGERASLRASLLTEEGIGSDDDA